MRLVLSSLDISISLGPVFLGAFAWAVQAQAAEDQTIIVTARREAERPINVPLKVDAVSANAIGAGGVNNLQSLAAHVPGLSFESIWGGANSFPVLRGQNQPSIAGDSVAMFIDGVYQANRDAIDVDPLDLERIEVVHGPQSALFGHSSFAGLIHYVSARPTEAELIKSSIDAGTDNLFGLRGILSGPISSALKARVAFSYRRADGTHEIQAAPSQHLGNYRRSAIAGSLATRDDAGPLSMRISGRYEESRSNQPPFFTLDYHDYNCGGRDPASGVWSYFCGKAPIRDHISLSPDIPNSRTRTGQIALHLATESAGLEIRSDTSFYRSSAISFRDFDGSADGELYGVCIAGFNCTGVNSLTIPVIRLQRVNVVQRRSLWAQEISQELRVSSTPGARFRWQLGGTAFWTKGRLQTTPPAGLAYGADGGILTSDERFSSLVLFNNQRVGPPAAINAAVTYDPDAMQIMQNDTVDHRRTIALFASADVNLTRRLRLRGEARANWERLAVDSRLANFLVSFGSALGAKTFGSVTPRISLDYRPAQGWLVFASYARGARSGGINPIPHLLPEEQTFRPESNWTAEFGAKYSGDGLVRSAQFTVYDIDWRNTQILGLSATSGVNALIVRNTKGIRTRGVEMSTEVAPLDWLELNFAYSYTNPRFKRGSEDPGSNAYCGLTTGITASSFCTIRPSSINPGQLVADISGNLPARVAKTSWVAGVTIAPPTNFVVDIKLHLDLSHEGNKFDRQIDGLYYGAHTLLGTRISVPFAFGELELWGTNLCNTRYVRVAVGRPPAFYLGIPRPTDLILGEGRRIGLTIRYAH